MGKFQRGIIAAGSGILSEASKSAASKEKIVYLNWEDLVPNQLNKYSMNEIEELAMEIKNSGGLLQPILYLATEKENRILAGHRRYTAIKYLIDHEGEEWGLDLPCIPSILDKVSLPVSPLSKEKYIIMSANSQREKTDQDKMREFEEQKEIYEEAKANGWKLPQGYKVRHLIAENIGVSPAQVGKMDYIKSHAIPPVMEAFNNGDLNINMANDLAHKAQQDQLLELKTYIKEPDSEETDILDSPNSPSLDPDLIKPKKERLIDTLEKESYTISEIDLSDIKDQYEKLSPLLSADLIADKKRYAKFLTVKARIDNDIKSMISLLEKIAEE